MRYAFALIAFVLLGNAARAEDVSPSADGQGRWYGTMQQLDNNTSYPMTLEIDGNRGTTDYPKLKCGGELSRIGSASGGYVVYKETITRGALTEGKETGCVDGIVIVHTEGSDVVLGWFGAFNGEPVLASARLTRSKGKSR
jgi:hypothetical protein